MSRTAERRLRKLENMLSPSQKAVCLTVLAEESIAETKRNAGVIKQDVVFIIEYA